jgi:hypothetical protein
VLTGFRWPGTDPRLTAVIDAVATSRTGSTARAVAVFVGAVVVGGVAGFALAELTGVSAVRWGNTQVADLAAAVGALAAGLLAGRLLLGRDGSAFLVRAPDVPLPGWPGRRFGAAALVLAPVLLLAGEAVRSGHYFFYPAQLAGMVTEPGPLLTAYSLYTAGLVLTIPAFLALAGLIGVEQPGWAFWGATAAVVGSATRLFQDGISFLALHLVEAQGLDAATAAVADTYGAWTVLTPLGGISNIGWALLAVGAYRARVLGWVPALAVAFMLTHYTGVLKGTDLNSLTGAVLLAAAFVPLGVALWSSAPPVPRRSWWGGLAAVAVVAALYLYAVLSGFQTLG